MDRLSEFPKSSIYAEKAYELILSGMKQCESAEDQRLLLESLMCQCALFARLLNGEQEFQALLKRLKDIDSDMFAELMPLTRH
ncbi:hypothetical protein EQ826_17550 [Ectopseudomonas mendocina]|nr:hypothetical protein [Pseudomonas mendocina]TRO24306.1 hypothetical protein EQ826_17550 [Pseudomonas mendocina]TRO24525.1 hypothetical protein EQ828_06020 [Pseudomonas mendocina]